MSMKIPNDTTGNRTRDLPACSAVPQPTAPPCVPHVLYAGYIFRKVSGDVATLIRDEVLHCRH
jgi:hypothetical protein